MESEACAHCGCKPVVFICFCDQKPLCQGCLSSHLIEKQGVAHKPVPLVARELVEEIKSEVGGDLRAASDARAQIEAELVKLADFQTYALEELAAIRKKWVDGIDQAIAEITDILKAKCQAAEQLLCSRLDKLQSDPRPKRRSASEGEVQDTLNFLSELVREMMPMEMQQDVQTPLYKFFGGQNIVSVFDPFTERVCATLQLSCRLPHSCCWALGSDGQIYVTGGSFAGTSRAAVFAYFPKENQVSALPDMQAPRRSHTSVVLDTSLYVFAGIDQEQKQDTCEALSLSTSEWSWLPSLTYARAYLGCTVYHGAVFIAGGAQENTLEVYHPGSNSFLCFALPNVDLTEACSLLALDHSVLIFHGNYRGEVLEYRPETGAAEKLADFCHGNCWSGCQPVLSAGKVYSVRLDSIIAFDIETKKSAFCARVGKVAGSRGQRTL